MSSLKLYADPAAMVRVVVAGEGLALHRRSLEVALSTGELFLG